MRISVRVFRELVPREKSAVGSAKQKSAGAMQKGVHLMRQRAFPLQLRRKLTRWQCPADLGTAAARAFAVSKDTIRYAIIGRKCDAFDYRRRNDGNKLKRECDKESDA